MEKRLNFFTFLDTDAAEWQTEQGYHRSKALRLGRSIGAGIVSGLQVQPTAPTSLDVVIQPGIAYDEDGRGIELETPATVSLAPLVPSSGTIMAYIIASLSEAETDPVYVEELQATKNKCVTDAPVVTATTNAPSTGQVELARVVLAAGATAVTAPANPDSPGQNEIDTTHAPYLPLRAPAVVTLFANESGTAVSTATVLQSSRMTWPDGVGASHEIILEAAAGTAATEGLIEVIDDTSAGAVLYSVPVTGAVGLCRRRQTGGPPAAGHVIAVRASTSSGTGDTTVYAVRLILR